MCIRVHVWILRRSKLGCPRGDSQRHVLRSKRALMLCTRGCKAPTWAFGCCQQSWLRGQRICVNSVPPTRAAQNHQADTCTDRPSRGETILWCKLPNHHSPWVIYCCPTRYISTCPNTFCTTKTWQGNYAQGPEKSTFPSNLPSALCDAVFLYSCSGHA